MAWLYNPLASISYAYIELSMRKKIHYNVMDQVLFYNKDKGGDHIAKLSQICSD